MAKYIGIDLGTANSTVSLLDDSLISDDVIGGLRGLPILQLDKNKSLIKDRRTLPSVLYFNLDANEVYTGEYAKTIYSTGTKPMQCVKSLKTRIGGETVIKIKNKYDKEEIFTVTEYSAILLKNIKQSLEQVVKEEITKVVVTVPAAFNTDERQATINAIKLAGFEKFEILDEPTAVLLYELNKKRNDLFSNSNDKNYLVYDIGGGTLDVTVAKVSKDINAKIDILARSPRQNFGGDNFDKIIAASLLVDFEASTNGMETKTIDEQQMIIAKIVSNSENIKIEYNEKLNEIIKGDEDLSNINERKLKRVKVKADFDLINNMRINKIMLTKEKFDGLFKHLLEEDSSLIAPIKNTLESAKINKMQIDTVVLTGGSSEFFIVEQAVKKFFGNSVKIKYVLDEAAVSMGAAIYNYKISGGEKGIGLSIQDKMADDIFVKNSDRFQKIISRDAKLGESGEFNLNILEENQIELGLFLYYGNNKSPETYTPIANKYIELVAPMKKGDSIKITWKLDENKLVSFSIEDFNEEFVLKNKNEIECEEIKNNHINKLIIR